MMPGQGHELGKLAAARDADPSPEELEDEFPGWHVFAGIGGLVYARRRPVSSPPIVLRDENTTELRAQMRVRAEELSR